MRRAAACSTSSCASKLRHMKQRSRWRRSASRSAAVNGRSWVSDSNRDAARQSSSSSAMRRILSEPAFLEAAPQRESRAVEDHPAIGRRDVLILTDGVSFLAEHLALEEDALRERAQAPEAAFERLPEPSLL